MATHVKELFIPIWHHPGFRTTGKLGLDALGLAVAWGLAMAAQSGQPSLPSLPIPLLSRQALAWMAVALASNLAFRLPSQHFRHFGRRDQGRVLAATGVLALASLLLPRIPGLGGGSASAFPGGTPLLATLATGLVWMAIGGFIMAKMINFEI